MSRDEEISLIARMASSLYSGLLSDPNCGFSREGREKCINESEAMLAEIKRRDSEKHSLPNL